MNSIETCRVYNLDCRAALFAALDRNERCEVDEELFEDFLELLPPRFMYRTVPLVSGETVAATFGFGEGDGATIVAFWKLGAQRFAQKTTLRTRG